MLKIYIMTHKPFDAPRQDFYVPLHVGRVQAEDLGYMGDDSGENISSLNPYYCELTGMHWVWKNEKEADIVGICHYRRYLMNEEAGRVLTKEEYVKGLERYDLLTTKLIELNNSYYYGFSENHHIRDLDMTGEVIRQLYPQYFPIFEKLVHENHTYFGNMIVMRKTLYDQYCSWLFDILFELQRCIHTEVEQYDQYRRRVYGFISEFLLYVYVQYNNLRVGEHKVGMIGEKAETRELKQQLAHYFQRQDVQGAKQCFMKVYQKRPDVLMEASDVTGELRLAMQIIATCESEQANIGHTILEKVNDFDELIKIFGQLNQAARLEAKGKLASKDKACLASSLISKEAWQIARMLMVNHLNS